MSLELIKRATCRITDPVTESRGTGYLLAPGWVGTAQHVVQGRQPGQELALSFDDAGVEARGRLHAIDQAHDAAVIQVLGDVSSIEVLPVATGAVAVHARWTSYGFPASAARLDEEGEREQRAGIWLDGDVTDPSSRNARGELAMQLYSRQAAAGQGAQLKGQSGAAMWVEGHLVGHLKNILPHEHSDRAALGVVYAIGVEHTLALLPQEARPAVQDRGSQKAKVWHEGALLKFEVIYAAEDKEHVARLSKHLTLLRRRKLIHTWEERDLGGADTDITQALEKADVALLMISPDFFFDDSCWEYVEHAMDLHQKGALWVVPILVRPTSDWSQERYGRLRAIPDVPVTQQNSDVAWSTVANELRRVVEHLKQRRETVRY